VCNLDWLGHTVAGRFGCHSTWGNAILGV
jgi:hypothetical protein